MAAFGRSLRKPAPSASAADWISLQFVACYRSTARLSRSRKRLQTRLCEAVVASRAPNALREEGLGGIFELLGRRILQQNCEQKHVKPEPTPMTPKGLEKQQPLQQLDGFSASASSLKACRDSTLFAPVACHSRLA